MEETRKDNTSPRAGGEGSHLPQEAEGLSISGPQMKLSWPQSLKCLLTTAPGDDYSFYWHVHVRKVDSANGPSWEG